MSCLSSLLGLAVGQSGSPEPGTWAAGGAAAWPCGGYHPASSSERVAGNEIEGFGKA